ncbi:MAG: phosphopantothenoylcysteine decarboxylase [Pirellulaceae bacterium]|jgi:phosphopantothenoylcysteine decarboxylase/phosphopantothenate--cysteine ligase|nr:phosphopantothenoylcysteine decarboxylase [Pirellulaceae bacterium]
MARILITSGPTREYLDPVRFLTNASSGRMGCALADATLAAGHDVVIVSGPVHIRYPAAARVVPVVTTREMLEACQAEFPSCDGIIATAAPCDYRPERIRREKISKTGQPLRLELVETPDIVATLAATKRPAQWIVGFALETSDRHIRALVKLERKSCNLIVLNGPQAIDTADASVEILDRSGTIRLRREGPKTALAQDILAIIQRDLMDQPHPPPPRSPAPPLPG